MAALGIPLQTVAGKGHKQRSINLAATICMQASQADSARAHSLQDAPCHAACQPPLPGAFNVAAACGPPILNPKSGKVTCLRSCLQRGGAAGVLALHGAHVRLKPFLAPVLQQLRHGHLLTILPSPHALAIVMQVPMHCALQRPACTFSCACLKTLRGRSS